MSIIKFSNVWEKYRIKFVKGKKVSWEEIWALKGLSFNVGKGEVLGIVGENGAGKSTILKLIAGMLIPDKGEIDVKGKVSVLMELGAGFNVEFTGRENIILNARVYGLNEGRIKKQMESVIRFADIGKFIDAPIKYYSQGMHMRLAFALAIFVEPDILLIDDILAVGDMEAQQRCVSKIFELKQAGKTIVLVSHNMSMVSKLCDRVILLNRGNIIQENISAKIISYYLDTIGNKNGVVVLEKEKIRVVFNNGRISITYNGFYLTKDAGGYVTFLDSDINSWSSSLGLYWSIKFKSSDGFVVEGVTPNGILLQVWTFRLREEQIEWNIKIKKDIRKKFNIDLFLISQYTRWIALDDCGDFLPFFHKSEWQNLCLNNFPNGILGLSPDSEADGCPNLILEAKNKNTQIELFNTGYEQECRVVRWDTNLIEDSSISINIFPDKDEFKNYIDKTRHNLALHQQKKRLKASALNTITSGDFKFFADTDVKSLKLYYKDEEITKGEGLHTSFLIKNIWYSLVYSNWKLKKENQTLIFHFEWKYLKFNQIWRVFFKDNRLIWQVECEAAQPSDFKFFKFGLFLNPGYKTFFCGAQQTDFPKEFIEWQDIPLENPKAQRFGLRKETHLPAVIFENKKSLNCFVQNSHKEDSCRALQLSLPKQNSARNNFSFSTQLTLLKENTAIDDYVEKEELRVLE